jgi:hypothetical protein
MATLEGPVNDGFHSESKPYSGEQLLPYIILLYTCVNAVYRNLSMYVICQ